MCRLLYLLHARSPAFLSQALSYRALPGGLPWRIETALPPLSANRRAIESTTPSGNWCEGVTNAARAFGVDLIPTLTSSPCPSTGIGWSLTLAAASAA